NRPPKKSPRAWPVGVPRERGDPNHRAKASAFARLLQELDGFVDYAKLEEALAQIGMRLEQVVELFERSRDLGIRTVDQLLDSKAGLFPEDVGELQHRTAGFLLLLDPVRSLLFGLPLSPGLKGLRHARTI